MHSQKRLQQKRHNFLTVNIWRNEVVITFEMKVSTRGRIARIHTACGAKRLETRRKRLGLSWTEFGLILDVSNQCVFKWDEEKARPRTCQLPAIASLRKLTKKEAAARLAAPV